MDLSAFEPILQLRDEVRRTLGYATAPEEWQPGIATAVAHGALRPPAGADLVAGFAERARVLHDQLNQTMAAGDPSEQSAMAAIVSAACAPLPPVDLQAVAMLGSQPATPDQPPTGPLF